jgi:hypothetical protein
MIILFTISTVSTVSKYINRELTHCKSVVKLTDTTTDTTLTPDFMLSVNPTDTTDTTDTTF